MGVGLLVGVFLNPTDSTTTCEFAGPVRASSSGTLVVSSSSHSSLLLLAVLFKKVESNVIASKCETLELVAWLYKAVARPSFVG